MYKSDYEALVSNPVWKEIVGTLEEIMKGLATYDLVNLDPQEEGTKLARQQGRYKMAEFVIAQPEAILLEIEEDNNAKEERKE
jgi:hypothetical protein